MTARSARCACDALVLSCEGEPALVSACHCDECRRRTGSMFGVAVFFQEDRVSVSGEHRLFARPSDSGFPVEHGFCPTCGSTVFWRARRKAGTIAVALGAFDRPESFDLDKQAYPERCWSRLALDSRDRRQA